MTRKKGSKRTTFVPLEEKSMRSANKSNAETSIDVNIVNEKSKELLKNGQGDKNQLPGTNVHKEQNNKKGSCNDTNLTNNHKKQTKLDTKIKTNIQSGEGSQTSIKRKQLILEEIDGDLFKLPKEYSFAHCIAEDLKLETGFAVDFKRKFGGIGKLIDQNLEIGDVGLVNNYNQNVFYLITRRYSNLKPTIRIMEKALNSLYTKMKELNLTKLGIAKTGSGFDELGWDDVKSLIKKLFAGSGIRITICLSSKIQDKKVVKPLPLKVSITMTNLWEMEIQTTIAILINIEEAPAPDWTDDTVNNVNERYPFKEKLYDDIKNKKLNPGDTTYYPVNGEMIICMFINPHSYYSCLEDAFRKIHRSFKNYTYLALQSGLVEDNIIQISWIVLLFRSIFNNSELWLCGDPEQTSNIYYDQYCRNKRNRKALTS